MITLQESWVRASHRVVRYDLNRYERWKAARPYDRFCATWGRVGAAYYEWTEEWWKSWLWLWRNVGKNVAKGEFNEAVAIARDAWLEEQDPKCPIPMVAIGNERWASILRAGGIANVRQASGLMLYDALEFAWITERARGLTHMVADDALEAIAVDAQRREAL